MIADNHARLLTQLRRTKNSDLSELNLERYAAEIFNDVVGILLTMVYWKLLFMSELNGCDCNLYLQCDIK